MGGCLVFVFGRGTHRAAVPLRLRIASALAAASLLAVGGLLAVQGGAALAAGEPVGRAFGAACASVTVIAIPGSYETTEGARADVAKAMLGNITKALEPAKNKSVRVHYIAYPAKIASVQLAPPPAYLRVSPQYSGSKARGYSATFSTMSYYYAQCPSTKFILLGYSQGAHIAGDIASTIENENRPVKLSRVRSVKLLADPARNPQHSPTVGVGSGSVGGLAGHRTPFTTLRGRVTEYCASNDGVCSANPVNVVRLGQKLFGSGPHTNYQNANVPGTRTHFTDRVAQDVIQDVVNLNAATF